MAIRKSFHGYCPLQQCEVAIPIIYVNDSSLRERRFTKGTSDCSFAKQLGHCDIECPIHKNAPGSITG